MAEWDTRAMHTRIITDARVPRGAQYRTIDNLLPVLDRHLRALVVPRLLNVCEDWLTQTKTYEVVADTAVYRLPSRNLRVLDVALTDSEGRVRDGFSRATATQAKHRRIEWWIKERGTPTYWQVDGSSLRLYPTPDASGQYTLRVRYARRPGRLVDSQTAAPSGPATVAFVSGSPGDASVNITPSGAFGTTGTVVVDILRATPGFESVRDDVTATVTTGGAFLTFTGLTAAALGVGAGDYVTLAGTSPVPQIPLDYITILELATVEQLCRENGDRAGSESARDARLALMDSAQSLLEPRADEQTVIVPAYEL